jgi:hypothetical protein
MLHYGDGYAEKTRPHILLSQAYTTVVDSLVLVMWGATRRWPLLLAAHNGANNLAFRKITRNLIQYGNVTLRELRAVLRLQARITRV